VYTHSAHDVKERWDMFIYLHYFESNGARVSVSKLSIHKNNNKDFVAPE
jgi:hypothetical protein